MKKFTSLVTVAALLFAGAASADPMVLDDTYQCSEGNQQNGINIGDVTGTAGGATDCWGTFDGNDNKDQYQIGDDIFDWVATQNQDGAFEGTDIGLTGDFTGDRTSGNWSFDGFGGDAFLIVLKAASQPGFAIWLFSGEDAQSTSGTWRVAWEKGLSHFSIYRGPTTVPEPGTLALLGLGLIGIGVAARRRKVA